MEQVDRVSRPDRAARVARAELFPHRKNPKNLNWVSKSLPAYGQSDEPLNGP